MSTTVVCVKVANIRPGHNNLQEWMKESDNVYIGRAGVVFIKNKDGDKERFPKRNSKWANPFKIDKKATDKNAERQRVIDAYREYILGEPELLADLEELRGKTLGCWCHPEPCHGDVLVELLNERNPSEPSPEPAPPASASQRDVVKFFDPKRRTVSSLTSSKDLSLLTERNTQL